MNKKKFKIIHVVESLTSGGVTEVLKAISSHLNERYIIEIIVLARDISGWDNNINVPIKCFNIEREFGYKLKDYFIDIVCKKSTEGAYGAVIHYITENKPDVLHFHTLPRFLGIGTEVNKKTTSKLVYTDHSARIPKGKYPFIQRNILGLIYKHAYSFYNLIYVSKSVEDVAIKCGFNSKHKKQKLINNGVDTERFMPVKQKFSKDKLVVIYVARISPGKGHFDLINAWKLIKKENVELWFVGHNEMKDIVVEKELINHNIKLLGIRTDIKELLEQADIGVFPSYNEGLPLALLEKMAMKLPVIISGIKELTDIIEDGKNGLVFELGNVADLAKKIELLMNDSDLRIKMGQNARVKVEKNYSLQNMINKLDEFYNELL